MPIFEYRCKKCETEFETLVRNGERAECPSCHGSKLEKLLSTFAAMSGKPGSGSSRASDMPVSGACGTCGDPRGPGACSMN